MKLIKIIDRLYLGNASTATNWSELEKHNIRYIVNISAGKMLFPSQITYLRINMKDGKDSDIKKHLDEVVNFIEESKTFASVLVHCKGAISRSPSFIIAYLCKFQGMNLDEAYQHVKKCRNQIKPQAVFIKAISEWLS